MARKPGRGARTSRSRPRTARADESPRHAGRPVGADGDRTRERIVEKAIETFADLGFAGASVRDIARKARIRVSSMYHYFPSKNALYEAVEEHIAEQMRAITLPALSTGEDLRQMTAESVGRLFDFYLTHPAYVRLQYRFHLDGSPAPDASRRMIGRWVGLMEGLMKPAESRGIVKAVDPPLLLVSVEGLLAAHLANETLYTAFYGKRLDDPALAARVRAHVIQMVLRAVGFE